MKRISWLAQIIISTELGITLVGLLWFDWGIKENTIEPNTIICIYLKISYQWWYKRMYESSLINKNMVQSSD